jgi:uncharacterized membrane-anchored protein
VTLTVSDLAPLIVVGAIVPFALLLLWLAVRQAHAPDKRQRKKEPQAGE